MNSMLKRSTTKKGKKVNTNTKCNRFLVSINVIGSTGPIRFVANEDDLVCEIIKTSLTLYARQARLPILGTNVDNFILFCVNDEKRDALSPRESIGSKQVRHFLLCKKQGSPHSLLLNEKMSRQREEEKGRNHWKKWLNKSLSYSIQSHCML
ncbi:uncharacterized protein LOC105434881 [Cucumis sativus]|uniref:DUF7054 domain-containing protein n=1 Tax=Cucumis sativus TaxID=3659 RepID=A0A0A0L707_CUCSA|nr:uncharacterized protein LOC105434881 [Cucumis sativus]KGN57775.1 hypothetical protein Csa_010444 [Cucumis sativus]